MTAVQTPAGLQFQSQRRDAKTQSSARPDPRRDESEVGSRESGVESQQSGVKTVSDLNIPIPGRQTSGLKAERIQSVKSKSEIWSSDFRFHFSDFRFFSASPRFCAGAATSAKSVWLARWA